MTGRARALRGLLLEALAGCDERVLGGLGALASWQALTVLWEHGWLGAGKLSVRATCAQIRERLREISRARCAIAAVLAAPAGTVVRIEGTIAEVTEAAVRVEDGSGECADLLRAETQWLGRPPQVGERVTALGFADSVVDPAQPARAPRALPRRAVIRAAGLPPIAHVGPLALPGRAR
jgi:hypothetical protein